MVKGGWAWRIRDVAKEAYRDERMVRPGEIRYSVWGYWLEKMNCVESEALSTRADLDDMSPRSWDFKLRKERYLHWMFGCGIDRQWEMV